MGSRAWWLIGALAIAGLLAALAASLAGDGQPATPATPATIGGRAPEPTDETAAEQDRGPARTEATERTASAASAESSEASQAPPSVQLAGRVVDAHTGFAVADATVLASVEDLELSSEPTNAAGNYELDGLPPGEKTTIEVRAPGYLVHYTAFELRGDSPFARDFELEPGRKITCEVVDFESGLAIAGAKVRNQDTSELTDAAGYATSSGWLAARQERLELMVQAEGYCRVEVDEPVSVDQADPRVLVRLPRGAYYEGRAVWADGSVAAGVPIFIRTDYRARNRARQGAGRHAEMLAEFPRKWELGEEEFVQRHQTDDAGYFRSNGLVPWSDYYTVRAYHARNAIEPDLEALAGPGSTSWVDIVMPSLGGGETGRIHGTLIVNGEPISGEIRWSVADSNGKAEVEEDGTYSAEEVPAGLVTLAAFPSNWPKRSFGWIFAEETQEAELAPDGAVQVDFVLEVDVATIGGQVVSTSGAPLAEIRVTASSGNRRRGGIGATVDTDDGGRFQFELPRTQGTYDVRAYRPPTSREHEGVVVGTDDLSIVLPEIVDVRLRILESERRVPLERVSVRWRQSGLGRFTDLSPRPTPDPEGWYDLTLPAESIDLYVRDRSEARVPLFHTNWHPVDGTRLELSMSLGATLRVGFDGAPIPSSGELFLVDAPGHDSFQAAQASDATSWLMGRARSPTPAGRVHRLRLRSNEPIEINGLAPGEYHVLCLRPDRTIEPSKFQLGPEGLDLQLRWQAP